MKNFVFNYDWNPNLALPSLSKINAKWLLEESFEQEFHRNKNGLIPLKIVDLHNTELEPTQSQINAIDYLLNNEELIIQGMISAFDTIIIPRIKKEDITNDVELSEMEYPIMKNFETLCDNAGIKRITILVNQKENLSFYQIDYEVEFHSALSIIFHRDKFTHFGLTYKTDDYSVSNVLGEAFVDPYSNQHEFQYYELPSGSNKKLKPWQIESNEYLPIHLVKNNKGMEAIKFLESGKAVNINWEALLKNAEYYRDNHGYDRMNDVINYVEENRE